MTAMADLYKTEGSRSQDTEARDNRTDDLVTGDIIDAGIEAVAARLAESHDDWPLVVEIALRAVAPMIAARAAEHFDCSWVTGHAIVAEREANAKIAESLPHQHSYTSDRLTYGQEVADAVAAAIRARGET
jgi:hypothetical protein